MSKKPIFNWRTEAEVEAKEIELNEALAANKNLLGTVNIHLCILNGVKGISDFHGEESRIAEISLNWLKGLSETIELPTKNFILAR